MWLTVLVLAIAVNFEPFRIGLVPLLLARPRPLAQLLAFLAASLAVSLSFGLLILFVFQQNPFGTTVSDAGKVQIGVGAFALALSAGLAVRWILSRRSVVNSAGPGEPAPAAGPSEAPTGRPRLARRAGDLSESMKALLRKGQAPWVAGLVGGTLSLPSVDFLALLIIIATSKANPGEQVSALVTFLIIGSSVVMAPLIGYLIAPERTMEILSRFGAWSRSRSLIEYAALLALIGVLLIAVGWSRL